MQVGSSATSLSQLNLARKWRSKKFNQVIGQDLSVRLIKNGLYRNLIFPVYLLSGTRGCGKTTMGRLFAAALNCEQLSAFQKNPRIELPCLECVSCKTMQQASHPDFIELDAASHTGVDNIRQLTESSSFAPIMGRKKIYLIDEAHMLSKAAFNALLKVLEEPPHGVVFLLATTDPHKIIDTVRSRCFQLFFNPLQPVDLIQHLAVICVEEKIVYEEEALSLIAHETEGSVRDAINLLERVRLVQSKITQESVSRVLGFCSEENILMLFQAVLSGNAAQMLTLIDSYALANFDASLIWKKLVELIRVSLWLYAGVEPASSFRSLDAIRNLLSATSYEHLVLLLEICYERELAFSKTSMPHGMLEMLLIKLAMARVKHTHQEPPVGGGKNQPAPILAPAAPIALIKPVAKGPWENFVAAVADLNDPLINSIFKQARFIEFSSGRNEIQLAFAQDVPFFKDWLDSSEKLWKPLMVKAFGANVTCSLQFIDAAQAKPVAVRHAEPVETKPVSKPATENKAYAYNKPASNREMSIDVKDSAKWIKANMVLKVFPGVVTQILN